MRGVRTSAVESHGALLTSHETHLTTRVTLRGFSDSVLANIQIDGVGDGVANIKIDGVGHGAANIKIDCVGSKWIAWDWWCGLMAWHTHTITRAHHHRRHILRMGVSVTWLCLSLSRLLNG